MNFHMALKKTFFSSHSLTFNIKYLNMNVPMNEYSFMYIILTKLHNNNNNKLQL